MKIDSSSGSLKKEISRIVALLEENGARFHDQLRIVERNGSISMQIEGALNHNEVIVDLPGNLLLPLNYLNVSLKRDTIVCKPDTKFLSPVMAEIASRIIKIYNIANKIKTHRGHNTWMLFKKYPALLNRLSEARSETHYLQKRRAYLNGLPDAMSESEFLCWSYFQTRVVGRKGMDNELQQCLMPVVDYFNHNYEGSTFVIKDCVAAEQSMKIYNRQPLHDKREVFIRYGIYDTLDLFMIYSFMDVSIPFVRSVPLNYEIDGHGTLQIGAYPGRKNVKCPSELEDIVRFMPEIKENDDGLELSHLIIPLSHAPNALRRILKVAIRQLVGPDESEKFVVHHVYKAEARVVKANIDFYQDFIDMSEEVELPKKLRSMILEVANVQLNKVSKYYFDPEFFNV